MIWPSFTMAIDALGTPVRASVSVASLSIFCFISAGSWVWAFPSDNAEQTNIPPIKNLAAFEWRIVASLEVRLRDDVTVIALQSGFETHNMTVKYWKRV